ncbi:RHS repeat-associated core domain-containing protein [Flavobacterium aquidurense]|uniref:RHS repeat-associated core domain-containing protein n=1 Tax=Flavobacterium aquidurense TaxID=362413 RepID=UPI003715E56E
MEPVSGAYRYIYQYKDHLGNVRLSYDKILAIKEASNFYPFGLKQEGYNTIKTGVENKYKYNGKELQDELGLNFYDYRARNYDPALGRWMNIDPLAEMSRRFSPFAYALNNPVYFIDPDGMKAEAGQSGNYYDWDEKQYKNKDTGKTVDADAAIASHSSDPPVGLDVANGTRHSDNDGDWVYNSANTTWVGQNGSKDIGNTIELNNINVNGYKSSYVPSGEYGPYTPDGLGITLSGSVDYNFTTYSMAFSLVANEKGKIGGFLTFGTGVSTSRLGAGLGASFDIIDTYGGSTVFEGLKGYSRGGGASYNSFGGSHYQSAVVNKNGQFVDAFSGVNTNSLLINFKPSTGGNYGITTTKQLF